MSETELDLAELKLTLDRLSVEASQGKYPAEILKEFKLSLDQLRLTVWAILAYDQEQNRGEHSESCALPERIAEFRLKRMLIMLGALQEDFVNGHVAPSNPDLVLLTSGLRTTLAAIGQVAAKRQ